MRRRRNGVPSWAGGRHRDAAAADPADIVGTITAISTTQRFPHLTAAFGSASADQIAGADAVYDDVFGIHTFLDGVAALIARRSG